MPCPMLWGNEIYLLEDRHVPESEKATLLPSLAQAVGGYEGLRPFRPLIERLAADPRDDGLNSQLVRMLIHFEGQHYAVETWRERTVSPRRLMPASFGSIPMTCLMGLHLLVALKAVATAVITAWKYWKPTPK